MIAKLSGIMDSASQDFLILVQEARKQSLEINQDAGFVGGAEVFKDLGVRARKDLSSYEGVLVSRFSILSNVLVYENVFHQSVKDCIREEQHHVGLTILKLLCYALLVKKFFQFTVLLLEQFLDPVRLT